MRGTENCKPKENKKAREIIHKLICVCVTIRQNHDGTWLTEKQDVENFRVTSFS